MATSSSPAAAGMARMNSSPTAAAGMDDAAGLDPWRRFFSGVDVFSVLVHAILVAATDSPQEFRRRRDSIVEQIYRAPAVVVPTLERAAGERPDHVPGNGGRGVAATRSCKGGNEEKQEMAAARRLATASSLQRVHDHGGDDNNAGGFESDWLHMLADEMDDAKMEMEEVLRIKSILMNHNEHSADALFESLRRLQLMQLTVDKLQSTEIGVAVAALEKHRSHQIRRLAQDIAKGWKVVTDEWVAATKAAKAGDSDKFLDEPNTSTAEDDGGLAIPPMDVGALYMSQATTIQNVSEFLDGIDDDGGILNNHITSMGKDGGSGSNGKCKGPRQSDTVAGTTRPVIVQCLSATQGSLFKKANPQKRRCGISNQRVQQHQNLNETTVHKTQVVLRGRQEVVFPATNIQKPQGSGRSCTRVAMTYDKPSSTEGEPRSLSKGTPKKTPHEDVNRGEATFIESPPVVAARKPLFGHVNETGTSVQSAESPKVWLGKRDIHLPDIRLERTKRRLREAYQESDNAKRKRTIQVMEPHDIPKPMGRKRPAMK